MKEKTDGKVARRARRAALAVARVLHAILAAAQFLCSFAGIILLIITLSDKNPGSAAGLFTSAASIVLALASVATGLCCLLLDRFATRVLDRTADVACAALLALSAAMIIASVCGSRVCGYILIMIQPLFPVIEAYGFEKKKLKEKNQ